MYDELILLSVEVVVGMLFVWVLFVEWYGLEMCVLFYWLVEIDVLGLDIVLFNVLLWGEMVVNEISDLW